MPTPDSNLYGSAQQGNLPFLNEFVHDILKKMLELRQNEFQRLPAPFVQRNKNQKLADKAFRDLYNNLSETQEVPDLNPDGSQKHLDVVLNKDEYDALSSDEKSEFFPLSPLEKLKFRKTGIYHLKLPQTKTVAQNNPDLQYIKETLKKAAASDQLNPLINKVTGANYSPAEINEFKNEINNIKSNADLGQTLEDIAEAKENDDLGAIKNYVNKSNVNSADLNQYLEPLRKVINQERQDFDSRNFRNYEQHYDRMARNLRDENKEYYLNEIAPNVNYHFMQNGLYNSNARNTHHAKVAEKMQHNLDKELVKLKALGFEKANEQENKNIEHAMHATQQAENIFSRDKERSLNTAQAYSNIIGKEKERALASAQLKDQIINQDKRRALEAVNKLHQVLESDKDQVIKSQKTAADMIGNQKESQIVTSKALENFEKMKNLNKVMAAEGLKNVGAEQYGQQTLEAKQKYLDSLAQKEHRWEELERIGAFAKGLPHQPANMTAYQAMENLKPNNWATAAGGLGSFAASQLYGQNKKIGGLVKRYATGGKIHLPEVKTNELEQQLMEHYQNLNRPSDEKEALLSAVAKLGSDIQRRHGQLPIAEPFVEAYHHKKNSDQERQARAVNLMQQIQQSRMKQQELLADLEYKNKHLESNERIHGMTHSEQKRHNQAMESYHAASLSGKNTPEEIILGNRVIKPKHKVALTPQDRMQLKELEKRYEDYNLKKKPYENIEHFLSENKEGNAPSTGWLAENTPNISDKARAYQRLLKDAVSAGAPPGVLTNAKLKLAEETKASERDSPEAVMEFAKTRKAAWEKSIKPLELVREYAAYDIPPRITLGAYQQWEKNGRKGNFEDYISNILEGNPISQSYEEPQTYQSHKLTADDIMNNSNLSKEQKIQHLKALAHG